MIVIIPLGGIGERFKKRGFKEPKALIEVEQKPILFHLLDNLNLKNIEFVYIPYNKEYEKHDFENVVKNKYLDTKFKFLKLESNTRGAAETLNIAIQNLTYHDCPVLCIDSDNFYLTDIVNLWNGENKIFTFKCCSTSDKFSYVDNHNPIQKIIEKEKISDLACCGVYGFDSHVKLQKYCQKIIDLDIRQKEEFFTSGVIQEMIKDEIKFKSQLIMNKDYFSLGTPEQVYEFETPFLFDLDGTLVNTDHIYVKVWNEIMKKYNLSIDEKFFDFFIQGKNDLTFLTSVFPTITKNEVTKISKLKDELFIEYLKNENSNIMIEGAKTFIEKNKNRKMAIITSCNKAAATFIIEKTELNEYMQFIIAAEDCVNHKPHTEPYMKGISLLNSAKEKCFIFEDSMSGYKSAQNVGGSKITLIIHENNKTIHEHTNEYKITNYNDFDIHLLQPNNIENNIKNMIIKNLPSLPIKNIVFDNVNMKTGYICDIRSLKIKYNDESKNAVLKIENTDNELSEVAKKIDLYNNENYFYKELATLINIETPHCFGTFILDNKNIIIMENLNDLHGQFDIDLNKNVDDILTITCNLVNMHNRYYFDNEVDIISSMKKINKITDIHYYNELVEKRFDKFILINQQLFTQDETKILKNIANNYNKIVKKSGEFPLNFCHGDVKSANIFFKHVGNLNVPIFLDWQYIHLNKGISDIAFLLVESTEYNENVNNIILNYYFNKSKMYNDFHVFMHDFKVSLCIFPFFVMVWFNTENRDCLLDKVFPIRFMKNVLKFYNHYLNDEFFEDINMNNCSLTDDVASNTDGDYKLLEKNEQKIKVDLFVKNLKQSINDRNIHEYLNNESKKYNFNEVIRIHDDSFIYLDSKKKDNFINPIFAHFFQWFPFIAIHKNNNILCSEIAMNLIQCQNKFIHMDNLLLAYLTRSLSLFICYTSKFSEYDILDHITKTTYTITDQNFFNKDIKFIDINENIFILKKKNNGPTNFFHFFFDFFPYIQLFIKEKKTIKDLKLFLNINEEQDWVQHLFFDILKFKQADFIYIDNPFVNSKITLIASFKLYEHWNCPKNFDCTKQFFQQNIIEKVLSKNIKSDYERILLIRNNNSNAVNIKRIFSNRNEIVNIAKTYGFHDIDTTKITLSESINLHYKAKYIILENGAGIFNLTWCNPDAIIIILQSGHRCKVRDVTMNIDGWLCYNYMLNNINKKNIHIVSSTTEIIETSIPTNLIKLNNILHNLFHFCSSK